jgi:hypothetical protein
MTKFTSSVGKGADLLGIPYNSFTPHDQVYLPRHSMKNTSNEEG